MTTALATTANVATAIRRALTTEESARADYLLLIASTAVEIESGYKFAPTAVDTVYTVGRKVRSGRVKLPAKVATVTAVRSVDQFDGAATTLTGYTLRANTVYGLGLDRPNQPIRSLYPDLFVEIDFTVTQAIPPVIVDLVAGIVARTLAGPPTGIQSETAGPFTKSYVNNNGDVYLSKSDKLILRRYKQPQPALAILSL